MFTLTVMETKRFPNSGYETPDLLVLVFFFRRFTDIYLKRGMKSESEKLCAVQV